MKPTVKEISDYFGISVFLRKDGFYVGVEIPAYEDVEDYLELLRWYDEQEEDFPHRILFEIKSSHLRSNSLIYVTSKKMTKHSAKDIMKELKADRKIDDETFIYLFDVEGNIIGKVAKNLLL